MADRPQIMRGWAYLVTALAARIAMSLTTAAAVFLLLLALVYTAMTPVTGLPAEPGNRNDLIAHAITLAVLLALTYTPAARRTYRLLDRAADRIATRLTGYTPPDGARWSR